MIEITSITDSPRQLMQIQIEGGDTCTFYMYYLPTQKSWYYDLSYKNHTTNGNKIVLTPNSLRNYKNILPFGIGFLAQGNVEPFQLTDFSSGRVKMYLLNSEEVQTIEETVYGIA